MSVLIFAEHSDGTIKKSSLEAISYGVALASKMGLEAHALVVGETASDLSELGAYGISKVVQAKGTGLVLSDTQQMAAVVTEAVNHKDATLVIFSNTLGARGIAPRVSVRLKAGLVTGAVGLPDTSNGFVVQKNVFSGKALTAIRILTDKKIITISPNSFPITKVTGSAMVEQLNIQTSAGIRIKAVNKATGMIPLAEAEKVISGGRGLKGPENWGLVEELAKLTGSATACSRAVADAHWRPHHEHVGQTGLAIAPNLYFAIGISGAIQHLAGVNRSKTIVVINKDPEAPFFKAADYGIVGDAFEVMPKIIDAVKALGPL
jgi:electron transfer flavoprotein alpha subunit